MTGTGCDAGKERNRRQNRQYSNVGNLGDILKHAALVSLARLISSRNPHCSVCYLDTHAFLLHAPCANRSSFAAEVRRFTDKYAAYRPYSDLETSQVENGLDYWCSIKLAMHELPDVRLYAAELDPVTRELLQEQLVEEGVKARLLLSDMRDFQRLDEAVQTGPLLALVDPFFHSERELFDIWNAASAGVESLRDPDADGLVELFLWNNQRPRWPDAPHGFIGPIATIRRQPYNLAVYVTKGIAHEAVDVLRALGWNAACDNERMGGTAVIPNSERERKRLHVEQVTHVLRNNKQRATYGAVGGLIPWPPQSLGRLLGERNSTHSWVVNAKTGKPTRYDASEMDPQLTNHLRDPIIRTTQELARFI